MVEVYQTKKNNYLIHYGIPGMKWGQRKNNGRIIRKINKQTRKANFYRNQQSLNKLARQGLYDKGPKSKNFANELVRLNRNIKQLDKYATYNEKKVKKLLQKASKKNIKINYDTVTKTYSIRD